MELDQDVKVWDPLVRVFHWSLAGAFFLAYITEEDFLGIHTRAGYVVAGLIVIRIIWGFLGPRYARFSSFVHPAGEIIQFLADTAALRAKRHVGHNPAGGAMILLLMGCLLLTVFTGLAVYGAEDNAGPLAPWFGGAGEFWTESLEEVHEFFAGFTLLLVYIHIAGVLIESLIHRENLIRAMFTGSKRADSTQRS